MRIFKSLLLIILTLAGQAFAFDESNERVQELLKKSQETRQDIESSLSKRDLASLSQDQKVMADEFQNLMNKNEDKDFFNEIDEIISD